jgi:hypothetical protein
MTFEELCRELGVEFRRHGEHRHVTEGWIGVDCPGCSPGQRKFKAGYCVSGRVMSCWSCGPLDVVNTLSLLSRRGWSEIFGLAKDLSRDKTVAALKKAGKYSPPPRWPLGYPGAGPHRAYLRGRGLDVNRLVKLWRVAALSSGTAYLGRVFIPVFRFGEEVSWTTRAIHPRAQPRYVSSPPDRELSPLKSLLYGMDYVRNACVVVEGPVDVWKIGPGAVATFGTNFTREQVLKLSKIPVRAVCFDSEPQAQRQADKLCALLECFPGSTYKVTLESGKDAGEADESELEELRKRFLGDDL